MKDCTGLKIKIADRILILNKYIFLVLSERRERVYDIPYLFDRKVFLTKLFSRPVTGNNKAVVLNDGSGKAEISALRDKLEKIFLLDKAITDLLFLRKEETAENIGLVNKINTAVKAYSANNP